MCHVQEVVKLEGGNEFREGYQDSGSRRYREGRKQTPGMWEIAAPASAVASELEDRIVPGGLSDFDANNSASSIIEDLSDTDWETTIPINHFFFE